jgi:hypothetical protein
MSDEAHKEIEITVSIIPALALDSDYQREKVKALLQLFDRIADDYGIELSEEELSDGPSPWIQTPHGWDLSSGKSSANARKLNASKRRSPTLIDSTRKP